MGKPIFTVTELHEDIQIWGLCKQSNDKTQSKDIPTISKKYYEITEKKDGEVIPFFVLSQGYDVQTKDFLLFVGGLIVEKNLDTFTIPKGLYVKSTVRPKLNLLWGLSIGEAKRAFYMEWLPKSNYDELNMEYEYHTSKAKSKNPEIDILFAIKRKAD
ncbi:MAG: AraC family transcriptional regulator [Clostridiales bacterium]|jgi:predicted transcriptional regulator YdeE|nr:AraC family transcriptional regulator [Clostridiales bacterium]